MEKINTGKVREFCRSRKVRNMKENFDIVAKKGAKNGNIDSVKQWVKKDMNKVTGHSTFFVSISAG